MPTRNAISMTGGRGRFLVAGAVLALLGVLPLSTLGVTTAPTAGSTSAATAHRGDVAAPAQALTQPASRTVARPNPDQVPLVAVAARGSGARVIISAPSSVVVGQALTVLLKVTGVHDLAGYEGVLRFDGSAAEFDSLSQRALALAGSGRDVQPLGPVVVPAGVAFGLYSCSMAGCGGDSLAGKAHPGASGTVVLAKLTLLPTKAGRLSIALGATRFVDAAGRTIKVNIPATVVVNVGNGRATYAAPAVAALRAGPARAVTSADISGDGLVGPADLNGAAIAWGLDRESGKDCGLRSDPADVNHDGCLDVQDLQLIAARVTTRPAVSPLAARFAVPAAVLTFTVNSTADTGDKTPGDGICATSANVCTLRAAITEANLHAGADTIAFNIPGSAVQTITIGSALPTINDITGGVTIDGYSQPGAVVNTDALIDNAVIKIQVTSASPTTDGFFASSSNNTIRGLAMYNLHRSIVFQTSSAKNNAVIGSFIGTNAAGTFVAPNWISGGNGVIVTQGASYTTVGGSNPADRVVLSGNEANGFSTYNEQTDHNVVQGDLVGLAPNGQPIRNCSGVCFGQLSHGIDINTGSSYNIIGGTGPGQRNVISNNRGEGIEFSHSSTTDSNQAIGNYIGTDVSGNAGAANKFGNGLNGIHLEDGTSNDTLAFNVIGNNALRADGSEVMGGIGIEGFYTTGISVHDNKIGVGVDGLTPFPNNYFGVDVHFNASWVTIGPGNIIANNPAGVLIPDVTDSYNTITQNSIYNNGAAGTGLGIQLLTGSNKGIGVPALSPTGVSLTAATGTACVGCTVEVFKAAPNPADASAGAAGQGKIFLGSTVVPAGGTFTVGFGQTLNPGDLVTATVTDAPGDTSQFSPNLAAASLGSPTPPPTPAPTPTPTLTTYASDTFSRTLGATWGKADIGGNYAGFYCTNPDMNVTGSAATVLLPDPHNPTICPKDSTVNGNYRGGYLTNVSAQDLDVRFRVATNTLSISDNQNVAFDVRRTSGFTSYRGQVRLTTNNQVWLQAGVVINNTMTSLGTNTRATAASVSTGAYIWVRGQVTGINPTTIRMKAWNAATAEPTTWAYTTTDSTPALQAPGAAGLLGWLSGNWTQAPVTVTFDEFNVTSPIIGTVPAAPVANFSSAVVPSTLGVNFTNTSNGGAATGWWWDFGDGTGSNLASPSHTYPASGTWTVKLTAMNDGGSSSKTGTVTLAALPNPPVAGFSTTQTPGTQTINFSDTSSNGPTSWLWHFGDGASSTLQNPSHAYIAGGPYNVSLTATNAAGPGNTTQPITVTPVAPPLANFSFVQQAGTYSVQFTDTSSGAPTSWAWDFGDSNASTQQNPQHTFADAGPHTVSLAATNLGGPGTTSQTFTLNAITPPTAGFNWVLQPGTNNVQFSDTSTGGPTSWSWDFGDGNLSTQQNPLHTFAAGSTNTVILSATNLGGTTTSSQSVVIPSTPVPVSGFTFAQVLNTQAINFSDASTNSPTSWAWDFGDGVTSNLQNPAHTYAGAGSHTVTLTASNAGGPSLSPASQAVYVVATPYAWDNFTRSAASGTWGTATVGGTYTYSGAQADFALTGSAGQVNLPAASANRAAFLPVNQRDVDLTYQFNISKLPAGSGSVYTYGIVRRSATADYRVKARIIGTGAVYLSFSQYSGGTETTIGSELLVPGLTYVLGADLKVHAQITGAGPTSLNARVWLATGTEPASWQITRTDSTAAVQVAGNVGLRAYDSGTTTNAPIAVVFDNLIAAPIPVAFTPSPFGAVWAAIDSDRASVFRL